MYEDVIKQHAFRITPRVLFTTNQNRAIITIRVNKPRWQRNEPTNGSQWASGFRQKVNLQTLWPEQMTRY